MLSYFASLVSEQTRSWSNLQQFVHRFSYQKIKEKMFVVESRQANFPVPCTNHGKRSSASLHSQPVLHGFSESAITLGMVDEAI
jgi:hypothetical protein